MEAFHKSFQLILCEEMTQLQAKMSAFFSF